MLHDSIMNALIDSRLPHGYGGRFYGVYVGIVTDIADSDNQGRVRIRLPWSPDGEGSQYEAWARLVTVMAGNNRGSWFIPDVDDEVMVAFNAGDTRHPYVIGSLWNGKDQPPESMDGGSENNIKTIRSRNGVRISLDDSQGQENLTLETPAGQKVLLKDGPSEIEVEDSSGNSVKLEKSGITVTASAKVTIIAGGICEISAGTLNVTAGLSRFSGVVQADTFISNCMISASYTPGAGNIW